MRTSSTLRKVLKVVLTLVVFIICDVLISYALVPYGTRSEVMWWEYRNAEAIDTIFIGDSLTQRGIDPAVVDANYDCTSLNMGTNTQEPVESYLALRQAFKDHKIKRVIYGFEIAVLTKQPRAAHLSGFLTEKWRGEGLDEIIEDTAYAIRGEDWLSTTDSLNIMFPWVKQHCKLPNVPRNINARLSGIDPGEAIAFGDSENDIPMLRAAGLGVAMGNAQPEVRAAADFVTLSNNENGIAATLERLDVPRPRAVE